MKTYISIVLVVLLCLVGFTWAENVVGEVESGSADKCISRVDLLEQRVLYLEEQLATVLQMAGYLRFEEGEINGLSGPHLIFRGVNVHVQNGMSATYTINGLGNLIVGYNEFALANPFYRTGSHNLVVGREHRYTNYGGFVAGYDNRIYGVESTVCGGMLNSAIGHNSSVSGGCFNFSNGPSSSILGGWNNDSDGHYSTVSGGAKNLAEGILSSVSGGYVNSAIGNYSSVSGGYNVTAPEDYNWAAGSLLEDE